MTEHDRIIEQAASWHAASSDDAMDWTRFTSWLEADPRHRSAYDEIALADAAAFDHRAAFAPHDDASLRPVGSRPRLVWAGGAIAAALIAMVAVSQFRSDPASLYTTAGTSRTIAFGDGTSIVLAPHSSLEVRGEGTRLALDGGAWFTVPHDPSRRLQIAAGPVTISDIGTRFDVQTGSGAIRVAVAEGRLSASAAALDQPLTLAAGQALVFDEPGASATISRVAPETIGNWRRARLDFVAAPLALVVADLERYAGVHVALPESLRDRRFSGSLDIRDGAAAARALASLMGLALRPDESGDRSGYRLESAGR